MRNMLPIEKMFKARNGLQVFVQLYWTKSAVLVELFAVGYMDVPLTFFAWDFRKVLLDEERLKGVVDDETKEKILEFLFDWTEESERLSISEKIKIERRNRYSDK